LPPSKHWRKCATNLGRDPDGMDVTGKTDRNVFVVRRSRTELERQSLYGCHPRVDEIACAPPARPAAYSASSYSLDRFLKCVVTARIEKNLICLTCAWKALISSVFNTNGPLPLFNECTWVRSKASTT